MVIDNEIRRRCSTCNHPLAVKRLPDHTEEWSHLYVFNFEAGVKNAKPHHMHCKCRTPTISMDKVQVCIVLQSLMKDDDTIRDPYAADVIRDLIAAGHPCYILSDEHTSYNKEIKEFLTYYEFPDIFIINAPHVQDYPSKKIHFDFDVIVDIDPVVWEGRKAYAYKHVILLTDESNKHISEPSMRANDWGEVETLIDDVIELRRNQTTLNNSI